MQALYPSQYQIPDSYKYKVNYHCTGNSHSNKTIVIIKLRKIIINVKLLTVIYYVFITDTIQVIQYYAHRIIGDCKSTNYIL